MLYDLEGIDVDVEDVQRLDGLAPGGVPESPLLRLAEAHGEVHAVGIELTALPRRQVDEELRRLAGDPFRGKDASLRVRQFEKEVALECHGLLGNVSEEVRQLRK